MNAWILGWIRASPRRYYTKGLARDRDAASGTNKLVSSSILAVAAKTEPSVPIAFQELPTFRGFWPGQCMAADTRNRSRPMRFVVQKLEKEEATRKPRVMVHRP